MKKGKEIHRKIKSVVAMMLLLAMVCTGCAGTNNPTAGEGEISSQQSQMEESEQQSGEVQEQSTSNAEESKQPESQQKDESSVDKSVYMDPTKSVEERVEALLAQMTLEEKVAQMVQPEQNGISLSDITKYGIGSVLSGGGSAPSTGNHA